MFGVDDQLFVMVSGGWDTAGTSTMYTGHVFYSLVLAPTGAIRYVVVDQAGRISSPSPELTAAVPRRARPSRIPISLASNRRSPAGPRKSRGDRNLVVVNGIE